jgi:Protein of unknown function/AsmA-like C-terminal region
LDALPSAAAQQTKPMIAPRRKRSSMLRRLSLSFAAFIIISALAAGGLAAFLSKDRVTALAKQQISRLAGEGYVTNLQSASLSFFGNGIASVTIEGISILNAETKLPLLAKGNGSFAISMLSLLTGRVELTSLSLSDAQMNIDPGVGQGAGLSQSILGPDGLIDPALVSTELDNAAATISNRLQSNPDLIIRAVNTRLTLGRGESAMPILIEQLTASKVVSGEFAFNAVISNEDWITKLTGAVGQTRADGKATPYRMTLDPVPFNRQFAPQSPDFKPRNCNGLIGFDVASSNGLASVDAVLTKAYCTFGALGDYKIDATINGKLNRGSGVFEIGRGLINVNQSTFNFDGAFAPARYTPSPELTGETPRYRYELVFQPSKIDAVENAEGPLSLTGKISGTYAPSERRLAVDELIADANGSVMRGAASLLFTDVTPALYLALTSDKMPVRDFKKIWPSFAAPTPRRIVMQRVMSGMISNMRLELQLPPGKIGSKTYLERQQLAGSGDLEDAEFSTFGELPPVREAKGRVRFDGVAVDILVQKGTVLLPSGNTATLKPSSFNIADTHSVPVAAELKVALSGGANVLAEIAAQKPINAFSGETILPSDLSGKADATGTFQLKLPRFGQKAPPPDYQVSVEISDLSVSKTVNDQEITKASGTIKATNREVSVRLDADLNGIPAKIIITEKPGSRESRTQEIILTLDDAIRDKIAPGLKGILSGPVSANIKGTSRSAIVELDLTKATLRVVPFNWEKGAGIGASASFALNKDGDTYSVTDLKITGRGLETTGKLQIGNGALQSADFRNVRLNPGDDFSLSLRRNGKAVSATLSGSQFDARALMKQMLPGRQPRKISNSAAVEVSGKIGRLVGFNDEVVLNADIGFTPGVNSALSLSGNFENGGSIDLSRTGGSGGRLIVQTGNAGAALRFVDLYKRMVGGTLATDFRVSGESGLAGPISISDFTVIGEPRLAKLASEQADGSASLAEATQADLAGSKAKFELAQGDVVLDRGTIRLQNGIVRGANVGATAEGVVLSATGQMDLRGTFMPARGLNRIVGSIPILGLILGSGSKAGLIGITYQLAGDAKNPKVFVNPISMIAPGVFRQIFE